MEILKHFEVYITAQKVTGIQFTVFGALLLLTAILLHFNQLNPITQGLRNGFFVISILLMVSGVGFIMNQDKLLKTKTESFNSSRRIKTVNIYIKFALCLLILSHSIKTVVNCVAHFSPILRYSPTPLRCISAVFKGLIFTIVLGDFFYYNLISSNIIQLK